MTAVINNHIEITQGVCGGKPRIAGHRIRVEDIAIWHERMGLSADEISLNIQRSHCRMFILHWLTITTIFKKLDNRSLRMRLLQWE